MSRAALVASVAAALFSLGACDQTFNIEEVHRQDASPDAPPELCLEDDFAGATLDALKWIKLGVPGFGSIVVDGQLSIHVTESLALDHDPYLGIQSDRRDFSGVTAEVEVVQAAGMSAPSEVLAQFKISSTSYYQIFVQRDQLVARKAIDGVVTDTQVPYVPTLHRFLRMRHVAAVNEMVYEARGVGTAWTEIATASAPAPLTTSTINLMAGSFNVAPAYTAVFDNVRVTGHCTF